jgi:alpha-ketoglutaric semialdehyde dehydrogenase
MSLQPVLINGDWKKAKDSTGTFNMTNPATKSRLPESYPVSTKEEVLETLEAGKKAAGELRSTSPDKIAEFLELFANKIEDRAEELVNLTNLETALPIEPRLRSGELPRTTNQLRQAAEAARDRSWCMAVIDTKSNIHSMFGALGGPVVVMGPNNFPFAFNSAAGGDFAAAIAAGNPVIAKANTSHCGTTKIFAEAAFEAVKESGLPPATLQLIYRTPPDVGLMLVSHPLVGATGFTGGRSSGLKLKEAADKAGKPIYLEMSSVNPVFVMPGALEERLQNIATELYGSCSLGAGQFCTNPGLVIIKKDENGEAFINSLGKIFKGNKPGTLLSAAGPKNIAEAIKILTKAGAEIVVGGKEADEAGYAFSNTLLRVSGANFLKNPNNLQTEAFGTVSLIIVADSIEQMTEVASRLEGNLTGSLYTSTKGDDDLYYSKIESVLRLKVGRLLNDKMPTGVAVVPSMNHGGPFPATGHPGFTAVGIPRSMLRFAALHCYDNVRHHRLPEELQDKNPTGKMWRFIDGQWTQSDVER